MIAAATAAGKAEAYQESITTPSIRRAQDGDGATGNKAPDGTWDPCEGCISSQFLGNSQKLVGLKR